MLNTFKRQQISYNSIGSNQVSKENISGESVQYSVKTIIVRFFIFYSFISFELIYTLSGTAVQLLIITNISGLHGSNAMQLDM